MLTVYDRVLETWWTTMQGTLLMNSVAYFQPAPGSAHTMGVLEASDGNLRRP